MRGIAARELPWPCRSSAHRPGDRLGAVLAALRAAAVVRRAMRADWFWGDGGGRSAQPKLPYPQYHGYPPAGSVPPGPAVSRSARTGAAEPVGEVPGSPRATRLPLA